VKGYGGETDIRVGKAWDWAAVAGQVDHLGTFGLKEGGKAGA
jgi:hypothetical protein